MKSTQLRTGSIPVLTTKSYLIIYSTLFKNDINYDTLERQGFFKSFNKSIMNRREEAIAMGRVEATYVDPTGPTVDMEGVEPRVDGYRSMNEGGRQLPAEYNVMIKQVNNGFFVEVGCQAFVFKTFAELTQLLTEYYANPQGVTERFYQGTLF